VVFSHGNLMDADMRRPQLDAMNTTWSPAH
jgi:hypothetical protein